MRNYRTRPDDFRAVGSDRADGDGIHPDSPVPDPDDIPVVRRKLRGLVVVADSPAPIFDLVFHRVEKGHVGLECLTYRLDEDPQALAGRHPNRILVRLTFRGKLALQDLPRTDRGLSLGGCDTGMG
ncbi:MAG: hypothetical protein ACREXR_13380 [Gammaproteobacteria bacterium]